MTTDPTPHEGILAGLGLRHLAVPLGIVAAAAGVVAVLTEPSELVSSLRSTMLALAVVLALWAVPAVAAVWRSGGRGAWAVAIVAALFAINMASLGLPRVGIFADFEWNWQGKSLDLVWCLALIVMLTPNQRREMGWTWATRPGSLPRAFINVVVLVAAGFVVLGVPGSAVGRGLTLERVLFDTTFPNLVEEIVFRGFLLALLDRAFSPSWAFSGARIGWGVVLTALLFGLAHGVTVDPATGIALDGILLGVTFLAGLVFGWIRALTGSLWPAYLAHCAPEVGVLIAIAIAS